MAQTKRKKKTRVSSLVSVTKRLGTLLLVALVLGIMARWVWINYSQSQRASGISRESAKTLAMLSEKRDRLKLRNELLNTQTGQLDQKIVATNGHLPGEEVLILIGSSVGDNSSSLSEDTKNLDRSFWRWLPFVD